MSMADHDDEEGWVEISSEEVTCPQCGGTGQEAALSGPIPCVRCHGSGLITQEVVSKAAKQRAEMHREVASHLHLGHRLFKTASELVTRELSKKGAPPLEYALIQNDLAQTHALLAIAELLKGAS